MRVSSAILLAVVGVWSVIGGSCAVVGGRVVAEMGDGESRISAELAEAARRAGASYDPEVAADAAAGLRQAQREGRGLVVAGVVILLGGFLLAIAAIQLLGRRGRRFNLLAVAVALLGEVLFLAMFDPSDAPTYLKIATLAFCTFAIWRLQFSAASRNAPSGT